MRALLTCSIAHAIVGAVKLIDYLTLERGRARRMADALAMHPAYLSQIANSVRPAPPEHCPRIERLAEGKVRRWDLRPYDWHRIWPELVDAEGAPPVPAEDATEPVPLAERAA